MNTITFAGSLTEAPRLRYTRAGEPVARFGVTVRSRVKDDDGGWWNPERAANQPVTVWGTQAEQVAARLGKGDSVLIHGDLATETWESDGRWHGRIVVMVRERDGMIGEWLGSVEDSAELEVR